MTDGSALPSFISFDPTTRILSLDHLTDTLWEGDHYLTLTATDLDSSGTTT